MYPDEIREIMTESGYTPSEEAVNNIRELIRAKEENRYGELSLDERSAVSGGAASRDYATEGCAATVEVDSYCFGTDGGCQLVNIFYERGPMNRKCPFCGVYMLYMEKRDPYSDLNSIYACKGCGLRGWDFDIFVSPYWK